MKRYDCVYSVTQHGAFMDERETGAYVLYSDHLSALKAERERARRIEEALRSCVEWANNDPHYYTKGPALTRMPQRTMETVRAVWEEYLDDYGEQGGTCP